MFLGCVVLFEVGSVLCGAAPNMTALIIGRVIGGIGGSGVYAGGLTYISVTTNNHERPLYLSGIIVVWGIGSVIGPIIGGAFAASSATWRWVDTHMSFNFAFWSNNLLGFLYQSCCCGRARSSLLLLPT